MAEVDKDCKQEGELFVVVSMLEELHKATTMERMDFVVGLVLRIGEKQPRQESSLGEGERIVAERMGWHLEYRATTAQVEEHIVE